MTCAARYRRMTAPLGSMGPASDVARLVRARTWYGWPTGGASLRPTFDLHVSGRRCHCPSYVIGRSVLSTPTRDRTGTQHLGRRTTDRETDAFSRRFEGGIPGPSHEPSNRSSAIRPVRSQGRQQSSLRRAQTNDRPPVSGGDLVCWGRGRLRRCDPGGRVPDGIDARPRVHPDRPGPPAPRPRGPGRA